MEITRDAVNQANRLRQNCILLGHEVLGKYLSSVGNPRVTVKLSFSPLPLDVLDFNLKSEMRYEFGYEL